MAMFSSYPKANIGLLKRFLFRQKNREVQRDYEALVRSPGEDAEKPRVIRDDYEALSRKGLGTGKDLYLFLRSLTVADTIRFYDDYKKRRRSFEEVLANAIDLEGERVVACVGNGGERWGSAQIHMDANWRSGIIPLFKTAVAIISMPSVTPASLEESYLIRSKKELLAKTLFVLPPVSCHVPAIGPKLLTLTEDFGDFQHEMVRVHREKIGLHFPEPSLNDGYFVIMDFETGRVAEQRPWKTVTLHTSYKSRRPSTEEKFPSLDEHDIRAAVEMVLRARGLRQVATSAH
jgi:hypothetical protein